MRLAMKSVAFLNYVACLFELGAAAGNGIFGDPWVAFVCFIFACCNYFGYNLMAGLLEEYDKLYPKSPNER